VRSSITRETVADVPLTFEPTPGGGSVEPAQTTTDALGLGGTSWVLGETGEHKLTVSAFNPLEGWPQWPVESRWDLLRLSGTALSCTD
jgi:hypothetical protein